MPEPLFEVWLMEGPHQHAYPVRCLSPFEHGEPGPWGPIEAMRVINKFQEKQPHGTYELVQVR